MEVRKVHIIGLAGAGMSALATIMRDAGWSVTGSDQGLYDPIKGYLEEQGFTCKVGHRISNIPKDIDVIVIGKHSKLVPETNEEVAQAFKMRDQGSVKVLSLPEAMSLVAIGSDVHVACGSYGKSTCTALAAYLLDRSGKNPSYFIGALPLDLSQHGKKDKGESFVIEGDEYPSANWDLTSKFLHYEPKTILLTSGEHDHLNVFPKESDYLKPYYDLLQKTSLGLVVGCVDNPNVIRLLSSANARSVTYGLKEEADWQASNVKYGSESTFSVSQNKELIGELSTQLLGQHNIQNILGVTAWMIEAGLLSFSEIKSALPGFRGIKRRLDRKSPIHSRVKVYEGFGSSYTKAKTAIDAMRLHFPDSNMIVVFEPHTFSWRNKDALTWYDTVFEDVSGRVFIYKPPTHGAETHNQLSLDEIVSRVSKTGVSVSGYKSFEDLSRELTFDGSDLVLILSSGSFDGHISDIVSLFSD